MEDIKRFIKKDKFCMFIGIELTEVSEGHAKAKMDIKEHHLNGVGIVQGGAIFTLADLAFAAARTPMVPSPWASTRASLM